MRVQRYALFPTPANLEGNFSPITTFLLSRPPRAHGPEGRPEACPRPGGLSAEPSVLRVDGGSKGRPPPPISRNHPEASPWASKRKTDESPQGQQDHARTRPPSPNVSSRPSVTTGSPSPNVSVFQCFNVKKGTPPHSLLLPAFTPILIIYSYLIHIYNKFIYNIYIQYTI